MFGFYSRTHVDIGRTHAEVVSGNAELLAKPGSRSKTQALEGGKG